MFNKIFEAMRTALSPDTLTTRKLNLAPTMKDFVNCISKAHLTEDELDDAYYIIRTISDKIQLLYVIVDSTPKELRFDTALRMDTTYIVIFHYTGDSSDNVDAIKRLLDEAHYIIKAIYDPDFKHKNIIDRFANFQSMSSKDKLLALAPYIPVCKLLEDYNFNIIKDADFALQEALNPEGIEYINDTIKTILFEKPGLDVLFDLNGFLLVFNK